MDSSQLHPTRELFLHDCLNRPLVVDEEPCPICLQHYDITPASTDTVDADSHVPCQTPSCGHKFGYSCLFAWAKDHNTCPMCRKETYERDEEDESPNRSMHHELMIGEDWESDEEYMYDPWGIEEISAQRRNELDNFRLEEEHVNSTNLALALQSLEVASESGDDTDEEEHDGSWASEADKEFMEHQRSCREGVE